MALSNILSITQARKDIYKLAEKVDKEKTSFIITEHGNPKAVLIPVEQYTDWLQDKDDMMYREILDNILNLKNKVKRKILGKIIETTD